MSDPPSGAGRDAPSEAHEEFLAFARLAGLRRKEVKLTCSILENPATKAKSRKVQLDLRDAATRCELRPNATAPPLQWFCTTRTLISRDGSSGPPALAGRGVLLAVAAEPLLGSPELPFEKLLESPGLPTKVALPPPQKPDIQRCAYVRKNAREAVGFGERHGQQRQSHSNGGRRGLACDMGYLDAAARRFRSEKT